MPSFTIHTVAGKELIKKINLTRNDKITFLISNLLPDARSITINPDWSEIERRKNIQLEKRRTHFRTNIQDVLEYPNINIFLNKYEKEIKENIATLGYFFHLYTDYYYFKFFLPKYIEFYDKDMNITTIRKDNMYIKMLNSQRIVESKSFWSKYSIDSVYHEYSKMNNYIMDKYHLRVSCDELREFISVNDINPKIEEIDGNTAIQVINKLDKLLNVSNENKNLNFNIFKLEDIDRLIEEIVNSFIEEYDYLLDNYK